MGTQLQATTSTVTATGAVSIVFPGGASPVGGFNGQAALGTATAAVVQLQVRTSATAPWLLADTLTLSSSGDSTLNVPVYPAYHSARWNVTSITGGNLTLDAIGVGI